MFWLSLFSVVNSPAVAFWWEISVFQKQLCGNQWGSLRGKGSWVQCTSHLCAWQRHVNRRSRRALINPEISITAFPRQRTLNVYWAWVHGAHPCLRSEGNFIGFMKFCGRYQVCTEVAARQEAAVPCRAVPCNGGRQEGLLGHHSQPSAPSLAWAEGKILLKPSFEKPCGLWRVTKNIKWK